MPEIIYEDNHLLVAVKPPNLLAQGDATGDDCLLDQLKRYIKQTYHKPGEVYLGLVHRMDRPVGGLIAFARTSKAASRLSGQLRTHAMEREYLAVVEKGVSMPDSGTLENWLLKDGEGGGVLINQAIHTLDLLLYFAGKPVSVRGKVSTDELYDTIEVEDTAHGLIRFERPEGEFLLHQYLRDRPSGRD